MPRSPTKTRGPVVPEAAPASSSPRGRVAGGVSTTREHHQQQQVSAMILRPLTASSSRAAARGAPLMYAACPECSRKLVPMSPSRRRVLGDMSNARLQNNQQQHQQMQMHAPVRDEERWCCEPCRIDNLGHSDVSRRYHVSFSVSVGNALRKVTVFGDTLNPLFGLPAYRLHAKHLPQNATAPQYQLALVRLNDCLSHAATGLPVTLSVSKKYFTKKPAAAPATLEDQLSRLTIDGGLTVENGSLAQEFIADAVTFPFGVTSSVDELMSLPNLPQLPNPPQPPSSPAHVQTRAAGHMFPSPSFLTAAATDGDLVLNQSPSRVTSEEITLAQFLLDEDDDLTQPHQAPHPPETSPNVHVRSNEILVPESPSWTPSRTLVAETPLRTPIYDPMSPFNVPSTIPPPQQQPESSSARTSRGVPFTPPARNRSSHSPTPPQRFSLAPRMGEGLTVTPDPPPPRRSSIASVVHAVAGLSQQRQMSGGTFILTQSQRYQQAVLEAATQVDQDEVYGSVGELLRALSFDDNDEDDDLTRVPSGWRPSGEMGVLEDSSDEEA